jgi:transcription elongation GreA/GreB family factor
MFYHVQLQEQEEDHATLTRQLMERVQSLEKDLQAYQQSTSDVESKFKVTPGTTVDLFIS